MIAQALSPVAKMRKTTLPTAATTVNDLRNLVRFLKQKQDGISPLEITDIFRRRLFEPCKLAAYKTWGIISDDFDLICLSPIGWKIAESLSAEARQYRAILHSIAPYESGLEWISASGSSLITYIEVKKFWNENFADSFPGRNEKTAEDCVTSFFHLCHAADLGIASVGRKGQPTRFSVDEAALGEFLLPSYRNGHQNPITKSNGHHRSYLTPVALQTQETTRLIVSCGPDPELPPSVREVLEITDFQYEVQIREEGCLLLSESNRTKMHSCRAALIVAGETNLVLSNGSYRFDDRLMSEIIASYALFEARVLLIWTGGKSTQIPFAELEVVHVPNKLDWETGLALGKRINKFKSRSD
jgi:hypothetical protein